MMVEEGKPILVLWAFGGFQGRQKSFQRLFQHLWVGKPWGRGPSRCTQGDVQEIWVKWMLICILSVPKAQVLEAWSWGWRCWRLWHFSGARAQKEVLRSLGLRASEDCWTSVPPFCFSRFCFPALRWGSFVLPPAPTMVQPDGTRRSWTGISTLWAKVNL